MGLEPLPFGDKFPGTNRNNPTAPNANTSNTSACTQCTGLAAHNGSSGAKRFNSLITANTANANAPNHASSETQCIRVCVAALNAANITELSKNRLDTFDRGATEWISEMSSSGFMGI